MGVEDRRRPVEITVARSWFSHCEARTPTEN